MSQPDDRVEFEEVKRQQSVALGNDGPVFEQSLDLITSIDKYDYSYLWSWMGVPIIQMPADVMATQEVIWATKPDVIIFEGWCVGARPQLNSQLLEIMGGGKVIGVDIDIRAHNRATIEDHAMSKRVALIEGGSVDEDTLASVRAQIPDGARVMVVLDSDHSREHVLSECRAYGQMVTEGCYLVVADTLVGHITEDNAPTKRSKIWFKGDEPLSALNDYLAETDRFLVDPVLNGKLVLSSSPGGYLQCIKG